MIRLWCKLSTGWKCLTMESSFVFNSDAFDHESFRCSWKYSFFSPLQCAFDVLSYLRYVYICFALHFEWLAAKTIASRNMNLAKAFKEETSSLSRSFVLFAFIFFRTIFMRVIIWVFMKSARCFRMHIISAIFYRESLPCLLSKVFAIVSLFGLNDV